MGAEYRLVRRDGAPLDIALDEVERAAVLGLKVCLEPAQGEETRAIRLVADEGFEDAGRDIAVELADSLGLAAVDLTKGVPLGNTGKVPWWAYWRGR